MMCPEELVLAVNTLAILISKNVSIDQMVILSAIFTQMGDTLTTITIQRELIEECCTKNKENSNIV